MSVSAAYRQGFLDKVAEFFSNSTPVTNEDIDGVQSKYDVVMPALLKKLIRKHNGATWANASNKVNNLISMSKKDDTGIYSGLYDNSDGYLPFADDGAEGFYAVGKDGSVVHFDADGNKTDTNKSMSGFVKSLSEPEVR